MSPSTRHVAVPTVIHTLHGQTMGTSWCVKLVAPSRIDLHDLHAGIQAQLDLVVAQMSTWRQDSDISRFNRAPAGTWQVLPMEFFQVLSCALDVARHSQGAYDPTVGPLVAAWGFGAHGKELRVPPSSVLEAALQRVGWVNVQVDPGRAAVLQTGGLALDLSAIAKGYGVDAVVAYLQRRHVAAALVEVGGELRAFGHKPEGTHWTVLVEDSDDAADDEAPCVLVLDGLAVATSGDRWHRFEEQGASYSHSIDPRDGQPVRHAATSVTVVAENAMRADAWATALAVIGPEPGLSLAEAQGIAVRFLSCRPGGRTTAMSVKFHEYLRT